MASEERTDPVEALVAAGLTAAGIEHRSANPGNGSADDLDFYLPAFDLYIEVKRFHTPRIAEQMSRAENVIAIQGIGAARAFAAMLARGSA